MSRHHFLSIDGVVIEEEDGYLWVRYPIGVDEDGNTMYGWKQFEDVRDAMRFATSL